MPSTTPSATAPAAAVRSLYADDPDFVELLADFCDRLEAIEAEFLRALRGEAAEPLVTYAHRLKGAAGSYGFPQLGDAAGLLEQAAKTSDRAAQLAAWDVLRGELAAVRAGFSGSDAPLPSGD